MRKALALLAAFVSVLSAAPALAAPSQGLGLAAWVRANTDLPVSQIALAGPENVYSLEPLGPPVPTGEVLALVRTEAVDPDWRAAHRFQSWDAHMLFDCQGGRVRVLRSASYPERGRQGPARPDDRGGAWFSPETNTPAATLLSAACDPAFSWPLRESSAPSGPTPAREDPPTVQVAQASPSPSVVAQAEDVKQPAVAPERQPAPVAAPPKPARILVAAHVEAPSAEMQGAVSAWPDRAPGASVTAKKPQVSGAQIDSAQRPLRVFSATIAAMRTCKRWAGAGKSWLVRGVEVAFGHGPAPPRADPGLIRQARAY